MTPSTRLTIRWDFWLLWIMAQPLSLGGLVFLNWTWLGQSPYSPMGGSPSISPFFTHNTAVGFLAAALIGIFPGIFQGMALDLLKRGAVSRLWWLMSIIGGCAIASSLGADKSGSIAFGVVVGVSAGLLQYLILMTKFNKAEWWILASIAGWAISGITTFSVWGLLITSVLSGIVSGYTMIWICQHPIGPMNKRRRVRVDSTNK